MARPVVVMRVELQAEGARYSLEATSLEWLAEAFPGAPRVPSVWVGYRGRNEFERLHGPLWRQIMSFLSGASDRMLRKHADPVVRVVGDRWAISL